MSHPVQRSLLLILSLFTFTTCVKEERVPIEPQLDPASLPKIITGKVNDITDHSAAITCTVTSQGFAEVTDVRLSFSADMGLDRLSRSKHIGSGTGPFIGAIDSLLPGTRYFVHATATNAFGGSNGGNISFLTLGPRAWRLSSTMPINDMVSDPGKVFAGTPDGLMVSIDTGLTWERINISGMNISSITKKGGDLFLTQSTGLVWQRTEDGVISTVSEFPAGNKPFKIVATNDILIIASDNGIFKSSDHGASWSQENKGLPVALKGTPEIINIETSGSRIYALIKETGVTVTHRIFYFDENSNNWLNTGINVNPGEKVHSMAGAGDRLIVSIDNHHVLWNKNGPQTTVTDFPTVTVLHFFSDNNVVVCTDQVNYFVSKDEMQTWKKVEQTPLAQFQGLNIHSRMVSARYIWLSTDRGVFRVEY